MYIYVYIYICIYIYIYMYISLLHHRMRVDLRNVCWFAVFLNMFFWFSRDHHRLERLSWLSKGFGWGQGSSSHWGSPNSPSFVTQIRPCFWRPLNGSLWENHGNITYLTFCILWFKFLPSFQYPSAVAAPSLPSPCRQEPPQRYQEDPSAGAAQMLPPLGCASHSGGGIELFHWFTQYVLYIIYVYIYILYYAIYIYIYIWRDMGRMPIPMDYHHFLYSNCYLWVSPIFRHMEVIVYPWLARFSSSASVLG